VTASAQGIVKVVVVFLLQFVIIFRAFANILMTKFEKKTIIFYIKQHYAAGHLSLNFGLASKLGQQTSCANQYFVIFHFTLSQIKIRKRLNKESINSKTCTCKRI